MAGILKYTPGAIAAYTALGFTLSQFNSLASGNWVLASSDFDNTTNLDMLGQVSFEFTMGGTTTAGAYVALYQMPLDRTATFYGDNQAAGATLPASGYLVSAIQVPTGIVSGSKIYGRFPRFPLERDLVRFGVEVKTGAALNAAAAAQVDIRTSNYNLNG